MGKYSVMRYKTKRRTKDLDLIYNDLSSADKIWKLTNQPLDETKPGLGQYYCIHCDKYCETATALKTHLKTKVHKRRVNDLKDVPYTQETSNAAVGVDMEKFIERVNNFKSVVGPEKEKLEKELKAYLDNQLVNSKEIDRLGYLDKLNLQEQQKQEEQEYEEKQKQEELAQQQQK
ncbi:hypothetical protein HANVADRAFT_52318 [Hanseniaspora valbyensis NRRL Y-1626]|uniref:C2H2-type domain-containing protein n=1 Tax=Hanseniaspora valbyensis NRRL Y-1626 TaxID=766949 RepID=A0A1B7TEV1_9ASCO|nr:hypothetical protein HANVADRAFT_52318 [Hanseniaspora valbyensis NRRL Y-1626]